MGARSFVEVCGDLQSADSACRCRAVSELPGLSSTLQDERQWKGLIVGTLFHLMGDGDAAVRSSAAYGVSAIGGARAVEICLRALQEGMHAGCRAKGAEALNFLALRPAAGTGSGPLADPRVSAALRHVLDDCDTQVRLAAIRTLGQLRDAAASEPISRMLEDADMFVRDAAANALVAILGQPRAVEVIGRVLVDAPKPAVRSAAALRLGMLGGRGGVPFLCLGLADQDASVRNAAVGALGRLGTRGKPALRPLRALSRRDRTAKPAVTAAIASIVADDDSPCTRKWWQVWRHPRWAYTCAHCRATSTVGPRHVQALSGVEIALVVKERKDPIYRAKVTCPKCGRDTLVDWRTDLRPAQPDLPLQRLRVPGRSPCGLRRLCTCEVAQDSL